MISICAVIACRNEAPYLKVLLPLLSSQKIDVVILDNDSTDGSHELYSKYFNAPIIRVEHIPYVGYFSLTQQLEEKKKVYKKIEHDWVIHHDADEIFEHTKPGLTLRDAVEEADKYGFNTLNFDEFVFLPDSNEDFLGKSYYTEMLMYYFFQPWKNRKKPMKNRKNSAWKRELGFENIMAGGHHLSGEGIKIFPENHIFRHYIALSYDHAVKKYLHRAYNPEEVKLGWHRNRLDITKENLIFPRVSPFLFKLEAYDAKNFIKDKPATKHYWAWES